MSVKITLDIPDAAFSVFRDDPEHFGREMCLAAAVKWYEMGLLSQSKAAELTGVSRHAFLEVLHRYHVSPFQITPEELAAEVENA